MLYLHVSVQCMCISAIYRYHLCGTLKFDEFPPGVTQVIVFHLAKNVKLL